MGPHATWILGGVLAAAVALPAQESREAPAPRPGDAFVRAVEEADRRFAAAAEAEDAGKPGMIVRAAFEDAAGLYRRAADAAAGDPERLGRARSGEGWSKARAGRVDEALAAFEAAGTARPADPEPELAATRVLVDAGRFEAARERATRLAARSPDVRAAATLLGAEALLGLGDRPALAAAYSETIPTLEDDARADAWRLLAFRLRDATGDAFYPGLLDAALKRTPDDPIPVFWRGDLALRRRRNAEALRDFRRYRDLRPSDPLGDLCVALAATRTGALDEAREALLKAGSGEVHAETLLMAARELTGALNAARRFADAAETQRFVVARSSDPEDALNLGVLSLDAGRPEEALKIYEAELRRPDLAPPSRAKALNYLGLLHHGQGRSGAAEAAFRASVAAWDDERDARENLGVLLIDLGRSDEARPWLEWCVARESDRKRSAYHLFRLDAAAAASRPTR